MNAKALGFLAATALLGATACSGSGKVSVSAKAATAGDTTTTAPACPLSLNGGDVCVTDIQIAVRRVSVEHPEGAAAPDGGTSGSNDGTGHTLTATSNDGSGGSGGHGSDDAMDEGEEKVGPCFVDLSSGALASGTLNAAVCAGEVPSGTYHELKVIIGPVDASAAAGIASLAAMNGESVIVSGSFKGGATGPLFQSALHVVQKTETTITVDSSTNVTLSFDPTKWFTAADGSTLDPTSAANQSQIEANIEASLRAFQDDDHNGQDDHGGNGHGGNDGAGHG